VAHEAYRYAQVLEIPVPVKTTTIAPTGTLTSLTGTSAGDQAIFAPWFIRRVRYSDMDPELAIKQLEGYKVYPDPDARNTSIVEFYCEDPLVSKVKTEGGDPDVIEAQNDITFEANLAVQAMLQEVWADNAISHTINLPPHLMPTEEEMEAKLMEYHSKLKGTTIFPDKSRRNAPFERVTKEQFDNWPGRKEISMFEAECKGGCPAG
jgi:ribonucleoside-triphosphate reductase